VAIRANTKVEKTDVNSEEQGYVTFEVFVQYNPLEFHVHVGSIVAPPSPEMALQVARENFLRRDKAVNIWVVRQSDVAASSYEDSDFYNNLELNRDYRNMAAYAGNAQLWKKFKGRVESIEEVAKYARG
jgi:ring-1,2-phenylacetyl-CoA epoxidase subunit PaaB